MTDKEWILRENALRKRELDVKISGRGAWDMSKIHHSRYLWTQEEKRRKRGGK